MHWHDLRHTFRTKMAEAGYSEATIAELMGTAIRKQRGATLMQLIEQKELSSNQSD